MVKIVCRPAAAADRVTAMTPPTSQPPPRHVGTAATVALLAAGVALWLWVDGGDIGSARAGWVVAAAVVIAVAVPAVRRAAADAAAASAAVAGPPRLRTGLCVAAIAACYFTASALWQGRDLGPHAHDEFMFLTQAQQVAAGRLWSRLDPAVADFFDSPYLIVRPVYTGMSWPGTALAYAPGARLGLPPWWTSVALAGLAVGAFFLLVREVGNPPSTAAVAAVLLAAVRPFHSLSVTTNAHLPLLLGGGVATVAALRWARSGRPAWAAAVGAAAGWALVTRPVDGVCLLAPVFVAVVVTTARRRRPWVAAAALAAATAAPFLALQLTFDHGVTGRWLESPFMYYCRRNLPQVAYGFPVYDPAARSASAVPQVRQLYDAFTVPSVLAHQPGRWWADWLANRLPGAFRGGQPSPLLLIIVPLGAAAAIRRRSRAAVVAASVPLFVVLYAPYTYFAPVYGVLCAPAVVLCATAGLTAVAGRWRSPAARAAAVAVVVGLAVSALPEVNGGSDDPARPAGVMAARALDGLIPAPARALVLVRYHPANSIHDEPVYNWTVAQPDDARIVLAHDLGRRDIDLFRHYAAAQPDRRVYLLDRADYSLRYLGTAADLAGRP